MPKPTADILPDEIIEKHLAGEGDAPQPTDEAADPLDRIDDTELEDEPIDDEELKDTEADEFGEEKSEEQFEEDEDIDADLDEERDEDIDDDFDLEDDEDDESDLKDEDDTELEDKPIDDISEKLTAEERELIEKDPALNKAYKGMQADYTRKTQKVARREREVGAKAEKVESFVESVRTPEGAVAFVKDVALNNPMTAAAAFEAIATGDGKRDFLIEVGLADRDALEAAYDRVLELHDNKDERERHVTQRDRERDDAEWKRKQAERQRKAFQARLGEIKTEAENMAERAKIPPEETDEVLGAVTAEIKRKGNAGEGWDLTNDEIKSIVLGVRKDVREREKKVLSRLERKQAQEKRERAKKKARRSKEGRVPPRQSSTPASKPKRPKKTGDPDRDLDAMVDYALQSQG